MVTAIRKPDCGRKMAVVIDVLIRMINRFSPLRSIISAAVQLFGAQNKTVNKSLMEMGNMRFVSNPSDAQ